MSDRRLVFLSHANPEQNDFTLWLSSQLVCAGYEVWSDLVQLIGGEIFWDDIESAIRHHAAKFVAILSQEAITKPGVLDEIAVAVTTERSQKIRNFVLPIRVDNLDFSALRANITRKNVIDFSSSWVSGLRKLLRVLQRDQIPCGRVGPGVLADWYRTRLETSKSLRTCPELIASNWLPVRSLPRTVNMFEFDVERSRIQELREICHTPTFPYLRLVGTFGNEADLRRDLPPEVNATLQYAIPTYEFMEGRTESLPGMLGRDARRFVSSLLRQSWDAHARRRGLCAFAMADEAVCWFFQKGQMAKDTGYFTDFEGKRRHRLVVGRSEVRKVYWHLGFRAKSVVARQIRFVLRPVVLFSEDGVNPLDNPDRMHVLRRSFCRNWWNDQWRSLMLTYIAHFSNEQDPFAVWAGDIESISVDARPVLFQAPVSYRDPSPRTRSAISDHPRLEHDEMEADVDELTAEDDGDEDTFDESDDLDEEDE